MMNYQITTLSKWGQLLYRAGLKSKRVEKDGSPKELLKLRKACENAELLLRIQEENKRLFGIVTREPLSAREWRELHELEKSMYPVLQRFVSDANLYEWPALATACIHTTELPQAGISGIPTAEEILNGD